MKKSLIFNLSFLAILLIAVVSCKKDEHKPPVITLTEGSGLVSKDTTLGLDTTIMVHVNVQKVEDDLRTFNVSYSYDGASSTTTKDNFTLTTAEYGHYEKDYSITTRNQAGSEKWIFTITDKDGNIASTSIVLTVQ